VIKIAAIVTSNNAIKRMLEKDIRIQENDKKNKKGKPTKFETGSTSQHFISILEVGNTHRANF
jgi:hypothetical protein